MSVLSLQWDPQGSPQTSLSATLLPHGAPHPGQTLHRSSVPDTEGFHLGKPDPYDLYEKSRAIYESRRKSCILIIYIHVYLLKNEAFFGPLVFVCPQILMTEWLLDVWMTILYYTILFRGFFSHIILMTMEILHFHKS